MAWRHMHNVSSDDQLDNPFIDQIAHTQFLERFRMPTIAQYKENRDPKEHVRRFHNRDPMDCKAVNCPLTYGEIDQRLMKR